MFLPDCKSNFRAGVFWLGLLLVLAPSVLTAGEYTLRFKTAHLAVYSTEPITPALQSSFQRLDTRIDNLQMSLGIYADELAQVYLVKDHNSYQQLALGKNRIVEFSEAFYSGKEQRIYIRSIVEVRDNYLQILLHEYIHWYLDRIFTRTPLWFHEGLATQYSGQMGFQRYLYFLQESFFGRRSDLFRMSYNYPENRSDWSLFYLSSSMAVNFMSQKKKKEWETFWGMVAAQHRNNQKAEFNDCFTTAYRTTLFDFHRQYAQYTKSLRIQYLIFSFNALLAMLLPLILIIAHARKQRRLKNLPELPDPEDQSDTDDGTQISSAGSEVNDSDITQADEPDNSST